MTQPFSRIPLCFALALGSVFAISPRLAVAEPASAQAAAPSAPPPVTNEPQPTSDAAEPTAAPEAQASPPDSTATPEPALPSEPVPVTAPAIAPPPPAADAPAGETPVVEFTAKPGDGATLKVKDQFSLNVKSRIQLRYQLDVPAADAAGNRALAQSASISTARLWFSGFAYQPEFTYLIQLAVAGRDYREGATSPLYDAYVDYAVHRDFRVRAGQYFVPFDRLRTVREWALQMAERPRPVAELTLDRDVGVTFYSDKFLSDESPFAWRVGVFGGGGTNLSLGKEPGVLAVARLELRPFGAIDDDIEGDHERRHSPRLALGVAGAGNWNTDRQRSTTGVKFVGGNTDYFHAAADLVFKWRGIAVQGEVLWRDATDDSFVSTDAEGETVTEYTRSGHGWVVQASYLFDPPFEIVGRLSRLSARSGTDPAFATEATGRAQEIAAGANYYLNGHKLKLQADWIARTSPDFDLSVATHGIFAQLDATF